MTNYPPGAIYDVSAPFNQPDAESGSCDFHLFGEPNAIECGGDLTTCVNCRVEYCTAHGGVHLCCDCIECIHALMAIISEAA